MYLFIHGRISERLLAIYDKMMYLLEQALSADVSQVLGALLFAWSVVIAVVLLVYWSYVGYILLTSTGDELSEEELGLLHWNRKRRSHARASLRWFLVC